MILHLLWDEKITGRIIKTFETAFPSKNHFIFWKNPNSKQHFYLRNDYCFTIDENETFPDLDYCKYDKVLIHGIDPFKTELIQEKINKDIPIYWLLWGYDLYNSNLYNRGYKLYYRKTPPESIKTKIKRIIKLLGFLSHKNKLFFNFFKERNVTMLSSEIEYNLFRKYYPKYTTSLKNINDYFYYPIDEILGPDLVNSTSKGNKILIGNSASWTNNHDYVFKFLKNVPIKEKEIITPLSYGGNEDHIKEITTLGKKYFGNNYKSLTEFLPLHEYNKLIKESEICIFGSWRQEAIGNIVIALYLGSKVFVSKRSPIVKILENWGVKFFILEEIDEESLHTPLSIEEKENNKDNMIKLFNWERLLFKTREIFG